MAAKTIKTFTVSILIHGQLFKKPPKTSRLHQHWNSGSQIRASSRSSAFTRVPEISLLAVTRIPDCFLFQLVKWAETAATKIRSSQKISRPSFSEWIRGLSMSHRQWVIFSYSLSLRASCWSALAAEMKLKEKWCAANRKLNRKWKKKPQMVSWVWHL